MIDVDLIVEPYCQKCPDFNATVDTVKIMAWDEPMYSLKVLCRDRERCKQLEKHFKKVEG